jgi:hypothetical protein
MMRNIIDTNFQKKNETKNLKNKRVVQRHPTRRRICQSSKETGARLIFSHADPFFQQLFFYDLLLFYCPVICADTQRSFPRTQRVVAEFCCNDTTRAVEFIVFSGEGGGV